ncbi:hypothetical protein BH18ACT2_BH18ACT2_00190 [soil metagenome]
MALRPAKTLTKARQSSAWRPTPRPWETWSVCCWGVLALAARQHGVISLGQLIALGITRSQLRTLTGQQVLGRLAPGVYGVVGAPDSLERRQQIGLLCLGIGAVLSHEAAARLHGFDRCQPDAVEYTMERIGRSVRASLVVHTTTQLPAIDRVRVDGWPCTSATRTVIDLARARISDRRLEAAIDSAVRSGRSSPMVIADRLQLLRGPGRWGARRLDRLLVDAGGHTMLERRFLELMRCAGLPRPMTQLVHRRDGRTVARVDFCFQQHALVVEVSGRKGHSSPSERACDAQRRNELQELGRRVYEFTYEQVHREGARVQAAVRRALSGG